MAELIPFALILAVGWLLLIRPHRRRRAAHAALQARLRPGDEVVTIGGVFGTIVALGEEDARLEVAPGTEIRVDRRAVARVVERAESGSEPETPS